MRAGKWYFMTLLMAAAFWLAGSNCTAQEVTAEGTTVLELPDYLELSDLEEKLRGMTDFSDLSFSDLVLELLQGKLPSGISGLWGEVWRLLFSLSWWAEAAGSADPADRAVFSSLYQFYPCI